MECFKCRRTDDEISLMDVISDEEIVKMCEDCARKEELPILIKPTTSQLKESERPYSVRERLRRMAGLKAEKEEIKKIAKKMTDVTLDDLYTRKKQKELEERYELEKKKDKSVKLIDNFQWHIYMGRQKKKLTRKQLAELIGESETAIKMLENKEIPGDASILINKLEQFLGIKLKREEENYKRKSEEEIPRKIDFEAEQKLAEMKKAPAKILKFDKDGVNRLTIGDLQEMKQRREEKEKLEKQKKMEVDELMKEVEIEEKKKLESRWKKEAEESLIGDELEF